MCIGLGRVGDGLYNLVKIVISFHRSLQASRSLADNPEELHRKGRFQSGPNA